MYGLAKKAKWIDKDRFGFTFKSNGINIFYSAKENSVKINIDPPVMDLDELPEKYKYLIKATKERNRIDPFYLNLLYLVSQLPEDKRELELNKIKGMLHQ